MGVSPHSYSGLRGVADKCESGILFVDPVHVGGDEKGLQDSVPAMDLGLPIKPNNQHISARNHVHVRVHVPNLLGRNNFCAYYGFPYLDYCYYVVLQKSYS